MAILFQGDGRIGGFIAYFTGDCDITLPTVRVDSLFGTIFGSDNAGTFLQPRGSELRFRFNSGNTTMDFAPQSAPFTISDGRIVRVGDQLSVTLMGETKTITSTGIIDIRNWGAYNNGSSKLQGLISGVATMIGDSSGNPITHDFDAGSVGDTQLTNTSHDSEHGTLSGFGEGSGFQEAANPTPSIANAGSDQSNVTVGDIVTLDSSGSTGAVSRQWVEITSTGAVLDDITAIAPTFTAQSFTELTEIEFQVTTTGSDGTTDTDNVSIFVLADGADGAVATDPTITLGPKTYSYYTRKADINGEAIFPISGVINNPPAGAVAEYQLSGGGWIAMPTDSNGNFADDIIISGQKNLTVRVSTNTDVTASASYLTAAPIWLAWWQSNESGRGASTQNSIRNNEITTGMVRPTMFKDGVWQYIADPTSEDSSGGSTWIRIAVEYAKLGIAIGVINVAVGGTSIERWVPSASDLWDTRIIAETTEADCGGVTYTASLGGESDVGKDSATMRGHLDEMINALYTTFGSTHYLTDIPRTYENGASQTLRDEFDYIIANNPYCRFGGDTEVIDVVTGSDGTHLKTGAQVNEAALIRFEAFTVVEEVNTAPTPNAGSDQYNIISGGTLTLNGSNTLDPSNVIDNIQWNQSAGTNAIINDPNELISSVTLPTVTANETMKFVLTITDSSGNTYTDSVSFGILAIVASSLRIDSYTIKFKDNKQKVIKGYDNEVFIDFTFANDFSLSEFTVIEIKIGDEKYSTTDNPTQVYILENRLVLNIGEETQLEVNKYKLLIIGKNAYYNSGHVFTSPVNQVLSGELDVIELT